MHRLIEFGREDNQPSHEQRMISRPRQTVPHPRSTTSQREGGNRTWVSCVPAWRYPWLIQGLTCLGIKLLEVRGTPQAGLLFSTLPSYLKIWEFLKILTGNQNHYDSWGTGPRNVHFQKLSRSFHSVVENLE